MILGRSEARRRGRRGQFHIMCHAVSKSMDTGPVSIAGRDQRQIWNADARCSGGAAIVVGTHVGRAGGAALALGVVAEIHLYHDDAGEEGDRRISPKE